MCILRYDIFAKVHSVGRAFNRDPQACCLDGVYHDTTVYMHIHVIYVSSFKLKFTHSNTIYDV